MPAPALDALAFGVRALLGEEAAALDASGPRAVAVGGGALVAAAVAVAVAVFWISAGPGGAHAAVIAIDIEKMAGPRELTHRAYQRR